MKINQDIRIGMEHTRKDLPLAGSSAARFGQLMAQQGQRMQTEQMTRLLGELTVAGDRLSRSRTMREFAKFKALVKRFMKEAVDQGYELKQSYTWNRYGEGSRLKTVETIDAQLLELMEELTDSEKSSLDLLERIGEIKGLLINLYT